jgi:hypothetical protein
MLRSKKNLMASGPHVNVEADSLNGAMLGPDVERGGDTWTLMVSDLVRDITQKAGQKCTAIRRVLVPGRLDELKEDVVERLYSVGAHGDPFTEGVTMGPVATAAQLEHVRAGLGSCIAKSGAKAVTGGAARVDGEGVRGRRGTSWRRRCCASTTRRRGDARALAGGLRAERDARPVRDRGRGGGAARARRRRARDHGVQRRPGLRGRGGDGHGAASTAAWRRSTPGWPARGSAPARCSRSSCTAAPGTRAAGRSSAARGAWGSTSSAQPIQGYGPLIEGAVANARKV